MKAKILKHLHLVTRFDQKTKNLTIFKKTLESQHIPLVQKVRWIALKC